jgi:hypothetical protein
MNELPAFRKLQNFIGEQTARPTRKPKGSKPETANSLTRKVVNHIQAHGGFATRLQSTGQYRDDLQKFVPSQQRSGLPDVMAVFDGKSCFVEIKIGRDTLSGDQRKAIAELEQAGACVFVAKDFESFQRWFTDQFLIAPFA